MTELPRDVRLARKLRDRDVPGAASDDVADELDAVGQRSDSYPFLALSRKIGAEYGDVLWFVDYLTNPDPNTHPSHHPSQHYRDALARLTHEQRKAIMARVRETRTRP